MTDQRDKVVANPADGAAQVTAVADKFAISRRALLRGASLAAPTILTLNSNAAFGWAVTSGTVGSRLATGDPANATCMVGAEPTGKGGVYYVDGADFIEVQGSPILYNTAADGSGDMLTPDYACQTSGTIYYSMDGGQTWSEQQAVQAPGGAVVSFAALSAASFNPIDVPLWPNV